MDFLGWGREFYGGFIFLALIVVVVVGSDRKERS